MKKVMLAVLLFSTLGLIVAGCGFYSQTDLMATSVAGTLQSQSMMETSVAATIAAMLPPGITPEPTIATTALPVEPVPNTQCGHLAVFISPAIASGVTCQNVPENINPDGMYGDTYPRHDELTLSYIFPAQHFHQARILVYPLARYAELLPDSIPGRVQKLQDMLAGGTLEEGIPLLPFFNAAQVFKAKVRKIENAGMEGFRFLTEYAQYAAPISNREMFYTFQGITRDGQYWVSVILPVTHPILPANSDNPPGDQDWETFTNDYEVYLTGIVTQIDALSDDSFNPSLILLDALVAGITVNP